jgi:hypothetical protein
MLILPQEIGSVNDFSGADPGMEKRMESQRFNEIA